MQNFWSLFSDQGLDAEFADEYSALIARHKLEGYAFTKLQHKTHPLKAAWQSQYWHNLEHLKVIQELAPLKEKMTLLKGASLLKSSYENLGQRFMGDIDLLIKKEDQALFDEKLRELGFAASTKNTWYGDDFKPLYFKKLDNGIELAVELHHRLFIEEYDYLWQREKDAEGFFHLTKEDLLLHLLGHIGYQHTFISLHWLLDIHLFISKFSSVLDFTSLLYKAKKLRQYQSALMGLSLVEKFFGTKLPLEVPTSPYLFLFRQDFLLYPDQHPKTYYLIKHFTKDNLRDALYYDLLWFKGKKWKRAQVFSETI